MDDSPPQVEIIGTTSSLLGEGLLIQNGRPIWLDIDGQKVFWDQNELHLAEDIPSVIFEAHEDNLLIGTHRGIKRLTKSGALELCCELQGHNPDQFRLNDGCKRGDESYLVGAMSQTEHARYAGSIYRFNLSGTVTKFDWPCHIPNSFIELPDGRILISDSFKQTVFSVRIDGEKLTASVWHKATGHQTPDGGCLLPDGRVAIAMWNGACIRLFEQDGTVVQNLPVPALRPTNCKYDPQSKKHVVTTARIEMTDEMLHKLPVSGQLLAIKWNS